MSERTKLHVKRLITGLLMLVVASFVGCMVVFFPVLLNILLYFLVGCGILIAAYVLGASVHH